MIQIHHNPRCSKSRECLAWLANSGAEYEIVDYLNKPLKFRQLKTLAKKLEISAIDMVRKGEPEWQPYKELELSADEVIRIIAKHPVLMQRPILVNGEKAVIARSIGQLQQIP